MILTILEEAEDTLMAEYYQPISERKPEVCIVEVPSIVIVIETGFGYYAYPMLVIETKMNAEIRDWSSNVCAFEVDISTLLNTISFLQYRFRSRVHFHWEWPIIIVLSLFGNR